MVARKIEEEEQKRQKEEIEKKNEKNYLTRKICSRAFAYYGIMADGKLTIL